MAQKLIAKPHLPFLGFSPTMYGTNGKAICAVHNERVYSLVVKQRSPKPPSSVRVGVDPHIKAAIGRFLYAGPSKQTTLLASPTRSSAGYFYEPSERIKIRGAVQEREHFYES